MKHLTEEQIVLHCYGDATDGEAVDQHLQACPQCRTEYWKVKSLLAEIPVTPVPEPPEYLEEKIWLNVRDRLKGASWWERFVSPTSFAIAGAMAVLLVAAFFAGRFWPHAQERQVAGAVSQANPQRVVLVAVGDHLERSQMLLIELMNGDSKDSGDLSVEQKLARNLLDDNRLYRQSAVKTGDPAVARLLDELERVLAEVANSPSDATAADMREIRSRIQSQDLLFKIQVVHSNVTQERETPRNSANTQRL